MNFNKSKIDQNQTHFSRLLTVIQLDYYKESETIDDKYLKFWKIPWLYFKINRLFEKWLIDYVHFVQWKMLDKKDKLEW